LVLARRLLTPWQRDGQATLRGSAP
jgi:hypothetical protein